MNRPNPRVVLRHLHHASLSVEGRGDAELLGHFLTHRDESAFAHLLDRHGPMVLAVCRRLLGPTADADDAFQATFVVFLRKVRTVICRERLGAWLHGVAVRVALKARQRRDRRRAVERTADDLTLIPARDNGDVPDGLELLDRELVGLPARYRDPLILCELQGESRRDAARLLGLAEGTLSSRLARGRQLLRSRLMKRGVAVPIAVLAFEGAMSLHAVPLALATRVLRFADDAKLELSEPVRCLVEGAMQPMMLTKIRTTLAVAAAALMLAIIPALVVGDGPTPLAIRGQPAGELDGLWRLERVDGRPADGKSGELAVLLFRRGVVTDVMSPGEARHSVGTCATAVPWTMDWIPASNGVAARRFIWKLNGDSLTICGADPTPVAARPTKFEAGEIEVRAKVRVHVREYRRVKDDAATDAKPAAGADVRGKLFHIVTDALESGEKTFVFPMSGSFTVLDAIGGFEDLARRAAGLDIWIVRPELGRDLQVNWSDITERGETSTNYQVLAGDRIRAMVRSEFPNPLRDIKPAEAGKPMFVNKRQFVLPLSVDLKRVAKDAMVHLLYSTDDGKRWILSQSGKASQRNFEFTAPTDGVYLFQLCVGNDEPKPERGQLRVVIDTARPAMNLRFHHLSDGGFSLDWKIEDANPAPQALRIQWRRGNEAWQSLPAIDELEGRVEVPRIGTGPLGIRVTATDMAGNVDVFEEIVASLPDRAVTVEARRAVGKFQPTSRGIMIGIDDRVTTKLSY